MAASVRPLTLGEILDRTVQLYRRNFLLFIGIATPAAALMVLISGSVLLIFSRQLNALGQLTQPPQAGQAPAIPAVPAFTESMLLLGVVGFLFILVGIPVLLGVFAATMAALNYAANCIRLGEPVTIRSAYNYSFHLFWRHVGILSLQFLFAWLIPTFILGGIILVGSIFSAVLARTNAGKIVVALFILLLLVLIVVMIVGCILIWLRFSLAYPVSAAENKKAWPSLKRSNQLTAGSRGRIFVMFLLVWIVSLVVSVTLATPIDLILGLKSVLSPGHPPASSLMAMQTVNLGVSFFVRLFVMPIYSIALVLFYEDQRTRLEGYDIERLMMQAGWQELPLPGPPVTALPPSGLSGASYPAVLQSNLPVVDPPQESPLVSPLNPNPPPKETGA